MLSLKLIIINESLGWEYEIQDDAVNLAIPVRRHLHSTKWIC